MFSMFKNIKEIFNVVFFNSELTLNVPYTDKEKAKVLGAMYSVKKKMWVINPCKQTDVVNFSKWIPKNKLRMLSILYKFKN